MAITQNSIPPTCVRSAEKIPMNWLSHPPNAKTNPLLSSFHAFVRGDTRPDNNINRDPVMINRLEMISNTGGTNGSVACGLPPLSLAK